MKKVTVIISRKMIQHARVTILVPDSVDEFELPEHCFQKAIETAVHDKEWKDYIPEGNSYDLNDYWED